MRFFLCLFACVGIVSAQGRVVVLGVDGMDAGVLSEYIGQDKLPNLAALQEQGGFIPLVPTNPAQSPTSWASLTTGRNPGSTGIFGFLERTVQNGQVVPEISMASKQAQVLFGTRGRWLGGIAVFLMALLPLLVFRRRSRKMALATTGILLAVLMPVYLWFQSEIPQTLPSIRNERGGEAFWTTFDKAGIKGIYLGAPCAFPAPGLEHGHLLCGLGVPDLAGTMGRVNVFRDEPVRGGSASPRGAVAKPRSSVRTMGVSVVPSWRGRSIRSAASGRVCRCE